MKNLSKIQIVLIAAFCYISLVSFCKNDNGLFLQSTTPPVHSSDRLDSISTARLSYQLVLWSSDFHISPIADIKHIMKDYNVRVIDKSLSGHCHLTGTCETDIKVINKANGIGLGPCPNDLRRDFFHAYRQDAEFATVDAVLCNHADSMCELFMAFDKPMVVIASTR